MRMPGIGGTGVVTVSQMLAAAAQHRRTGRPTPSTRPASARRPDRSCRPSRSANRSPGGSTSCSAFDLLASVTAGQPRRARPRSERRRRLDHHHPHRPHDRPRGDGATSTRTPFVAELDARSRAGANPTSTPPGLTAGLLGDAVTANVFLLGVAYQAGVLPVPAAAIERAIDLNGTAVEANLPAFRWGRLWVVDPERVERQAGLRTGPSGSTAGLEDFAGDPELQRMLAVRLAELIAYQDRRYAQRYLERRAALRGRRAGSRRRRHVHPHRRPPAAPAHGLQGRVRGRPPPARRRRPGRPHRSATSRR